MFLQKERGQEETFRGVGCVHDIDYADRFVGIYLCPNIKVCVKYVQLFVSHSYLNQVVSKIKTQ